MSTNVSIPRELFDDIQSLLGDIKSCLDDREQGGNLNQRNKRFFDHFFDQKCDRRLDSLASQLGGPGEGDGQFDDGLDADTESDFSSFLTNVGGAVVDAQRQLDHESEKYLNETAKKDHVLPSVFRIPKVSANIKFAMKKVDEKGFNIILAKKKNESEVSLNQGLDFEVVAVPPPPEVMAQLLKKGLPNLSFELSPHVRDGVFSILDTMHQAGSKARFNLLTEAENRNRVLLVHVGAQTKRVYWIFYATKEDEDSVGIWYLEILENAQVDAHALIGFGTGPREASAGESYKELRDLIFDLGEQQEAILLGQF